MFDFIHFFWFWPIFWVACGERKAEESSETKSGLIGNSCYARPVVLDDQGKNVCITPDANWPTLSRGEFWYGPFTASLAYQATLKACHDANALDYGSRYGKSCYRACEEVVSCVVATPNPEV